MADSSSELVHAYRMARDGSSLQGTLTLSRLSRLVPLQSSERGEARFKFDFAMDPQSRPLITGRIQASVELICQRCLEPMTLDLDLEVRLGIVRSDDEAVALSGDREPLLLEAETVSLVTLIEDELILGLPAAPLHPAARCGPPGETAVADEGAAVGPFSELQGITQRNPNKGE